MLGAMLLYAVLHIGFRLVASWSLGEDDPIANIHAQDLRLVYAAGQLPLYEWVLHGVQKLTGPTLGGFLLIKYAALTATGLLLYAIARHAFGAGLLALMAVESLALIYQVSWRYHEGFTHQVLAMLAVSATLLAMVRVVRCGRAADFVFLGAAAGLGLLTQPIYALFLLCLVAAVAVEPDGRRVLSSPSFMAPVVMVALIAGGYGIASGADLDLPALVGARAWPPARDVVGGLVNALRAPLFYLSPLILILPLLFPGFLSRAGRDLAAVTRPSPGAVGDLDAGNRSASGAEPSQVERIVLRTSVLGFVLSSLGAGALGLKGYSSHTFMPLYVTSLVWLMGVVRRAAPTPRALGLFGRVALGIAALALVARLANMFVLDPVCRICRWGIPYDGLAAAIRTDAGPRPVIVTPDHELGGNLRAWLPDARIVLSRGAGVEFVPRGAIPDSDRLVLVWADDAALPAVAAAFAPVAGVGDAELSRARAVAVPWRHLWRPDGYRSSRWRVLIVKRRGGEGQSSSLRREGSGLRPVARSSAMADSTLLPSVLRGASMVAGDPPVTFSADAFGAISMDGAPR